jgi:hypothetical protein
VYCVEEELHLFLSLLFPLYSTTEDKSELPFLRHDYRNDGDLLPVVVLRVLRVLRVLCARNFLSVLYFYVERYSDMG